jgi:hypothetical protein
VASVQFCLWAVSPSVGSVFSKIGSALQALRLVLRLSMLHALCSTLMRDKLQRSDARMMVRPELPEADCDGH